jgi:hypothetical protein
VRYLHECLEEIYFEEGPRVAAVCEGLTTDGWDPLLHMIAYMDPAVTQYPRDWAGAAEWTTRHYNFTAKMFAQGVSQSPWWVTYATA